MLIFVDVIFPVFLIFLSGFILQKIFKLDIKPISTLAVYLLLPFLVFTIFYTTPMNLSFFYIAATSLIIMLLLIAVGIIACRLLHYSKSETNAFLLSTIFANSGNYGVPIILFAFGKQGVAYAMPLMVFHAILMGFVGIYIAANGKGSAKMALRTVLKQPMNYVILPALLLQMFHIHIPANFMQSIELVSNTSIPIIMIILGMQLANVSVNHMNWGRIGLATFIRLIISPAIAFLVCLLFPIDPLLRNVIIVMAAMPSAANTTLYAIQFNAQPQFVSSCTLITTVISALSLDLLLCWI
ncbi:AEC family transporter [Sporolactobacillus shoreicorticis]|uniref:AEC family transporter n=1 Tax=Sporolactobacillus shoreicorticis TaxID=1923877 RepID=A0ABW5S5A6_9BACL|nr:AEC family transporter [Sporolactobacillus shoreicorticis]MCO7124320.1 AEC family transporter [Sporolactobacillus shoreicorticis]